MDSTKDLQRCFKDLITSGNEIYSDFTVEVKDDIFRCHRFVLSSCSSFFRDLFRADMQETGRVRSSVRLADISRETFQLIYQCIYFNDPISQDDVVDVWRTAHVLKIDFIISACQKLALETMDERNVHNYQWHVDIMDRYVMANYLELVTFNFDRFKDIHRLEHCQATIEFAPDLLQCFKILIASGDEICSDFTVKAEDEIFHCHRFILSSCSSFFRTLFRADMQETYSNSVRLEEISRETFKLIYECIYFNEPLNESNILDFWKAAHFLQIDFIVSACQKLAMETINEKNCHRYFWHAKLLEGNVMAKVLEYISCSFDRFKDSEYVMALEGEELLTVVQDDYFNTSRYENVVNTILKWVMYTDIRSRKDYLVPLLSTSRLASLKLKELTSVFKCMHALDKRSARDLIVKAYKYRQGHRFNYWSLFAGHSRCLPWEGLSTMPASGSNYIAVFSLTEKSWVRLLDSSSLPPQAILLSHKGKLKACYFTANSSESLSMSLLTQGDWQRALHVKHYEDAIQLKAGFEPAQQSLMNFSFEDRVVVVHANSGHILEWDHMNRNDLQIIASASSEPPIIYITPFEPSILVMCATRGAPTTLKLYDTATKQWGVPVPFNEECSLLDNPSFLQGRYTVEYSQENNPSFLQGIYTVKYSQEDNPFFLQGRYTVQL